MADSTYKLTVPQRLMQTMRIVARFDVLKHTPTGRFSIGAMPHAIGGSP